MDTTVKKVDSARSPQGRLGEHPLVSGKRVAMRLWKDEAPQGEKPTRTRDYETVGFALAGRAVLHLEGQTVLIEPGDAWLVPAGAEHTYEILETFSAVEATAPPAQVHDRDHPPE